MKKRYYLLLTILLATGFCLSAQDYPIKPVPFTDVKLTDSFWAPYIKRNHDVTIPIALKHCYNTGRIDNFIIAAKLKKGKFQTESPFDDSDVFKIIEGASYTLQTIPDKNLEAHLDALIYYIGQAQEPDGYLYTNRTIDPEHMHPWVGKQRWEMDWDCSHELYNIGHLYEAAVAHYQATGKRNLLDIAIKSADLVCKDFGPGKLSVVPGHQVIEMGLVKLYRVTGDEKYLNMAKFFLDIRGRNKTHTRGEYCQDHAPVTEQFTAVGHAVRACYMYAGMADVAALMNVPEYVNALDKIWDDIVYKKYYLTGGIGATAGNEGFGVDYYLPNMSAYNETCASIAEIFWNQRMFLLEGNSKFYDILERTLYNGTISGISLSGDHFFYPNPLQSAGQHSRSEWFGCACCPSNLCRFIPSIPGYMYAIKDNRLYVNLFIQSEANVTMNNSKLAIRQNTHYPWDGTVDFAIAPEKNKLIELAIRIPGWAQNQAVPGDLYSYINKPKEKIQISINGQAIAYKIENGYAIINREWKQTDKLTVNFPMPIRKVVANPKVKADNNRIALERGPILFCLEWTDNKNQKVNNIFVSPNTNFEAQFNPDLLNGVETISGQGFSVNNTDGKIVESKQQFTAIPYYAWANRGKGEMTVWIPTEKSMLQSTIASQSKVTASHEGDIMSINDGECPSTSDDNDFRHFHWWPNKGTTEWVQYNFAKPVKISSCSVYWFDGEPHGECRLPVKWIIYFKNNKGEWQAVKNKKDYPVLKNTLCNVNFESVETSALKLEIQCASKYAGGIYEWTVK